MASFSSYQTFGIELELIIFYTTAKDKVPSVSTREKQRYGPILKCPHYTAINLPPGYVRDETESWQDQLEALWVREQVAEAIETTGYWARALTDAKAKPSKLWSVVPEIGIKIPCELAHEYKFRHVGVEVKSPPLVASEASFQQIARVVKAINSSFRRAVPPVCGFHVHVGRDLKHLRLDHLRRIASLTWMAEALIGELHPGCRHGNQYCLSSRGHSDLAYKLWKGDKKLQSHFDDDIVKTLKLFNRYGQRARGKPTEYRYRRTINVMNLDTPTLSRSVSSAYSQKLSKPRCFEPFTGLEIANGARLILGADNITDLLDMTANQGCRSAYNFTNARPAGIGGLGPRQPTIEFRQAAGSLDEAWIVIWVKICLALCGPAVISSSEKDFLQLLNDCKRSKENPRGYDIFDLLYDIGISPADMDAVYHRLRSERFEQEPALLYHRPADAEGGGILHDDYEPTWMKKQRNYETTWPCLCPGDQRSFGDNHTQSLPGNINGFQTAEGTASFSALSSHSGFYLPGTTLKSEPPDDTPDDVPPSFFNDQDIHDYPENMNFEPPDDQLDMWLYDKIRLPDQ
ncbi:putative amidoligase enzyme-domain-containing protein [Astrocystis sublimbata]|nr:putative amidoligase enzyme-domain-containing protein [Astrocystis sublimbata]